MKHSDATASQTKPEPEPEPEQSLTDSHYDHCNYSQEIMAMLMFIVLIMFIIYVTFSIR